MTIVTTKTAIDTARERITDEHIEIAHIKFRPII